MSEQLCSWGLGSTWSRSRQLGRGTGAEREGERGQKNDFNSAVTTEMSDAGHMGFTAGGL